MATKEDVFKELENQGYDLAKISEHDQFSSFMACIRLALVHRDLSDAVSDCARKFLKK